MRLKVSSLLRRGVRRQCCSVRWLNLQEYKSKTLLDEADVNIQRFIVVDSAKDARHKLTTFKAAEYVVKAQILAGGRGKGHFDNGFQGGVKLTKDANDVVDYVANMIGHRLVTRQTPKDGMLVNRIMVCESVPLLNEKYIAIMMDRDGEGPVIIASATGGVEIEEIAETAPSSVFKVPIDIVNGLSEKTAKEIANEMNFRDSLKLQAAAEIRKLYDLFVKVDATQIEINPMSETEHNGVLCVDAKVDFDDSAWYRQRKIFAMEDIEERDEREVIAERNHLSYVSLDGDIACLVNGAGLAMATMDLIKLYGGEPANFLDVGGGVGEAQVLEAFKIIDSDSKVKAILVNIFGGIVNCETIAKGLIGAFKTISLTKPLIVRLEGNNVVRARELLASSKLPIITANNLDEAAKRAVHEALHMKTLCHPHHKTMRE